MCEVLCLNVCCIIYHILTYSGNIFWSSCSSSKRWNHRSICIPVYWISWICFYTIFVYIYYSIIINIIITFSSSHLCDISCLVRNRISCVWMIRKIKVCKRRSISKPCTIWSSKGCHIWVIISILIPWIQCRKCSLIWWCYSGITKNLCINLITHLTLCSIYFSVIKEVHDKWSCFSSSYILIWLFCSSISKKAVKRCI